MTPLADDVTFERFVAEWDRCSQWLQSALDFADDGRTLDSIFYDVNVGDMQFWPGEDSAMVTQLLDQPNGTRECNVLLGGGTLETLERMLHAVEDFALQNGASAMTVIGRRGWEKSFLTRDSGYKAVATVYRKDLPRG